MQFIAIVAAIFATSAAAQWTWNGGASGSNDEGRYFSHCTCTVRRNVDPGLGQQACQNLSNQYSNLYWDGNGCVDANGQGVEGNGMARACRGVGGAGRNADRDVDATCY